MKSIKLLVAGLLLINLSSCHKTQIGFVIGRGINTTTVINKSDFSSIDLDISANVLYTQDSIYKVEISAQPNVQKVIDITTDGSVLKIRSRRSLIKHNTIIITVHSPSIYNLSVSGSGKIAVQKQISTTTLDLDVSGSGHISIPSLKTQSIKTSVSGSGNITISGGTAENESLKSSGSGNTMLVDLLSKQCDAHVSGSGNINVWCTENLEANVSGSGKISYRGSPNVNSKVSGSGKVIHLN